MPLLLDILNGVCSKKFLQNKESTMSGRKNKKLRKQIREDKIQKRIELSKLAELPAIPVSKISEFLASKFIGKTGYHYISIGKVGSLFLHKDYENIVPIILHNSFPVMSATGKFNDVHGKDCAIGLVKVKPEFPGLVIDRHLDMYLGGSSYLLPEEETLSKLCDLERVSVAECNHAIKRQEEIFSEKMNAFMESVKKSSEKLDNIMTDPYCDPYLDESVVQDDMTDYLTSNQNDSVEIVK